MKKPNILVIDMGLGNIGSVISCFQRLDCSVESLKVPPTIEETNLYTHAVLPGVGSFKAGMEALKISGWYTWIKNAWNDRNKPFLGICLGMQLLATFGTEGADKGERIEGLGIVSGDIRRHIVKDGLVLPHVGWNNLHWKRPEHVLAKGLPIECDMYFVHSYTFNPNNTTDLLATCNYGNEFAAIVGKDSCYGVQFHPEKSQRLGKRILENFISL